MDSFEPEETPRKPHPTDFFRGYSQTYRDGSEETVERIVAGSTAAAALVLYAVGSSRMPGSGPLRGCKPSAGAALLLR